MAIKNVQKNDQSRVFLLTDGIFKCDPAKVFSGCVSVDGLAQDRGEPEDVECPSDTQYGAFDKIDSISGELSRMTTTLTGRMSRTELSTFYQLFIDGCNIDMHVHWGLCQRPDDFNKFDKAMIFEGVEVTSFGTDPLVALTSGDRAAVNETVDISIREYYEVVPLAYSERASTTTTDGPFIDIHIADTKACGGTCGFSSNGCQKVIGTTDDGFLYFSTDGGITWSAGVDTGITTAVTTALSAMAFKDTFVVAAADNNFYYINTELLFAGSTTFSTLASGLTNINSMATNGVQSVLVADGGVIAVFTSDNLAVSIVDNGAATTANLSDVFVTPSGFALTGGVGGALAFSPDTLVWSASPSSPTANNITAVVAKSELNWLVGTALGELFCTDDGGVSWSQITFSGAATPVTDLAISKTHVLYLSQGTTVFRSIDGGASWVSQPTTGSLPANTSINALAACPESANTIFGAGESVGADGFLLLGRVS